MFCMVMYYLSTSVTWLILWELCLRLPRFVFKIPLRGVFKFVNFYCGTVVLILYFWETLNMMNAYFCLLQVLCHKWDVFCIYQLFHLIAQKAACLFGLSLNLLSLIRVWNRIRIQIRAQLMKDCQSMMPLPLSRFSFSLLQHREEGLLATDVSQDPLLVTRKSHRWQRRKGAAQELGPVPSQQHWASSSSLLYFCWGIFSSKEGDGGGEENFHCK